MSKPRTAAGELAASVRAARGRRKATAAAQLVAAGALTFRAFLQHPDYFPASPDLSPAIWAIVDASDGRPDLIESDELCEALFGCVRADMPGTPPRVLGVSAGRRGGKTSRLLAPKAVHLAWTVPLPNLLPGEVARVAIVAPDKDTATATLNFVKGVIGSSEVLRAAVVGDVGEDVEDVGNAGAVTLRRPDGKLVDITVRAASAKGGKVRSRSLCGLILDEACFFFADDGHTVNDRAIFDAAQPAIEPGGQAWIASTPWIDGEGLLEQLVATNHSSGTQGRTAVVAARVGTRLLRPGWDPDGSIEAATRAEPDGDLTADREICAIPLRAGSRRYFAPEDVDAACGTSVPAELAPQARGAGADYGHTSDRSALALADRYPGGIFGVSLVKETASSPDQRPSATYADYAKTARGRGVRVIASDVHVKENAREEYERHGVSYRQAAPTDELFAAGRTLLREKRLALGQLPESDQAMLRRQLGAVLVIPGERGRERIHLPRTSVKDALQGRGTTHCDALVATLTALHEVGAAEPALWAHEEERREVARKAEGTWTPPPGSLASARALRNGGRAPTGRFY